MELQRGPLTRYFLDTLTYLLVVWVVKPGRVRPVLEPLYLWWGICAAMLGFGLELFVRILTDWQLLRGRPGLWRRFYGNMDDSFLEQYRRMLTYEHGEVPVTTGFSSAAMLLMMAAIAVSFVWFAFLA